MHVYLFMNRCVQQELAAQYILYVHTNKYVGTLQSKRGRGEIFLTQYSNFRGHLDPCVYIFVCVCLYLSFATTDLIKW